uniref:RNA-directed RNA polymerase n=1 Tax=Beauveria bassiana negative transcribed RNA virus 1 TaxID=3093717 RepID=A0AAF1BW45_9MONO|nr:MAG: RNA-dependent RNA polymerase [Beauveria bassiana negative transcribed RNA virus 1]
MDDDDLGLRPSKVYFMDTNLDSPVLTTELDSTKEMLTQFLKMTESSDAQIKASYYERIHYSFFKKLCLARGWTRALLRSLTQVQPEQYADIEVEFLKQTSEFPSFYDQAQEIAKAIEKAVADGLAARGLPRESIEGTADTLGARHVLPYRRAYEQFCNLFGRAESRVRNSEHIWTKGVIGSVEIWIHIRYALLSYNGKLFYSSLNQILMLKDKLASRYMFLEHVAPLKIETEVTSRLTEVFSWQDRVLTAYGNKAYGILKAVEPMFKTRLSHISDNVFGNDTAYTRMITKIRKSEAKVVALLGVNCEAVSELISIVERTRTTEALVEMFGSLKTCGHPIINPVNGGLSAAQEARSKDKTSLLDAQLLRNTFCHIFLTTYVEKNGSWPRLLYLKSGLTLEILNTRQERNLTHRSYPLSDWNHVEWEKLFDMDYFPNFLELMDDKSISYYRSEKHLAWERGARPSSQRRLLLEVLRREHIDLEPLVKRISKRDIPWDWLIVSLYPKEREFKEDPRMFSMLVLEMRCFFTCIEANIANNIFKYMPQQTMTKTKTQIQERFLTFTDPARNPTDWPLFLEIDLSRWNLKWRELVIHMLGHDFNRMFGVKGTFTLTHWFFSRCQIVVRVNGLRPAGIEHPFPPESGLAWRDHLGGFEGINQKLWTAATYAMVEMALAPMLANGTISGYELIGQGDNQVLRVSIPIRAESREDVLPRVRDEINERLEKTCASVGQEVKPEENVESATVATYSKDVYVRGVEYPTSLKKHSRLFPVTAADFPSTAMNASAIMAGSVAAAENARHPLCSAVIGWYHTARYLLAAGSGFCIHGKDAPRLTAKEVTAALILPPSIGGYIGTPIASFMYKAGSDPLGKEISSLRLLSVNCDEVGILASRALRGLEEKYCIDPEPNLEVLIDNPYGLPLSKRPSPMSKVSHLTLEAFRSKVVNKDIRPLLDASVATAETTLKKDILAVTPLNPLLAHDLFDASGFGTVKLIRKMFLATRTIQTVAQWANPHITHIFVRADRNDMLWFKDWVKGLPQRSYSGRDSYDLVSQFREYWGIPLHGVTNYQPLDCNHSSNTTRHPSSLKWSSHSSTNLLTTRGPLSGYLGTATRVKRSEHGYKIVDAGSPSRAMMKLQLIRSQAYGNKWFNELLDRIGLTRTNLPLSVITDLLTKVVGGSISHKYSTFIRHMAASYIGPLNFVTHIRLDTDSIGKVSGGSDDYAFMTQEFMVLALSCAKLLNIHKGIRSGEMIIDTDKMIPLPPDTMECPEPQFTTASLPKSKLLYTPDLMIARTYDSVAQVVPRGSIARVSEYSDKTMIESAAVGFFMDLLRDKSKAKLLADTKGLAAIPASFQMDIAEAHALGPLTITRCIAVAILLTTIRDTFRTLHLHPERWDESLFLVAQMSTCIKACASYLTHPLMMSRSDSSSFAHSRLKYAGSMAIFRRAESHVRRNIMSITSDPSHSFWDLLVPVFSGSQAMTPLEGLTIAGSKEVYKLYIMRDPSAREFGNLFSSYTRMPTGTKLGPDALLSLLRMRFSKLATVYRKAGDRLLAKKMEDLGSFRGVLVFNDDVRTVLRNARSLHIGKGTPRPKVMKRHELSQQGDLDSCPECLPAPLSKHESMWKRYALRKNGGMSSAGYTWLPIVPYLKVLDNVVVVGSGNGGLADLLLSCYNCEVIGTDLESDMPRESATLLHYVPLGIQSHNSPRYTQSDLCLTTTGDWMDKEVRRQFLSEITTSSTVFVDITPDLPYDILPLVLDVMDVDTVERLYLRYIGNRDDVSKTFYSIRAQFSTRLWCVGATVGSDEVIFEISRNDPKFLHKCPGLVGTIGEVITPSMHNVIPIRGRELACAATESVYAWEYESLEEMDGIVRGLCLSLLNKSRKRQMFYKDRISLVRAHLTLYLATHPSPILTLQNWIADEMCETDLLRYATNSSILSHLLRYVPRLRQLDLSSEAY